MEKKEIIENNKLIAEFMRHKYLNKKEYAKETGCPEKEFINIPDSNCFYHSSWDLLMPIIEKIESIHYTIFDGIPLTYRFYWSKPWAKIIQNANIIAQHKGPIMIESVYKVIVEFIKWWCVENRIACYPDYPSSEAKYDSITSFYNEEKRNNK